MATPDHSPPATAVPTPPPAPGRPRRMLGAVLVIGGVLLSSLLLYRLLAPRPVPPPQVVVYTPQQAADARKNLHALGAQLLEPPPASAPSKDKTPPLTGKPGPAVPADRVPVAVTGAIHLRLSEADLNTYLATDPKVKTLLASRGIQAVQLFLQEPHAITCRASLLYKGRKTNVQITGDLLPDRNALARFVATKAQVGTLPLPPKFVTAQADRIVARFLGRVRGRIPVTVQDIEVVDDYLVLTGVRRPARKA